MINILLGDWKSKFFIFGVGLFVNLLAATADLPAPGPNPGRAANHSLYLNSDSLPDAYQDFKKFYDTHQNMATSGIHPAILFAQELLERDEESLALRVLNYKQPETLNIAGLKESSIINNCIRVIFYGELTEILADPELKPWLRELIQQTFPNHQEYFSSGKLTLSDAPAEKRKVASNFYALMVDDKTNIKIRRNAAVVTVLSIQKRYLNEAQLEVARVILSDAFDDRSLSIDDRLFFIGTALCIKYHAFGNDTQKKPFFDSRKSLFETLLNLSEIKDSTPEQKITSARIIVWAADFDEVKSQYSYLANEEQRHAAINVLYQVIIDNPLKFWPNSMLILHAKKTSDSKDGFLATQEQREMIIAKLRKTMNEGRDWQKLEAALELAYSHDLEAALDLAYSHDNELFKKTQAEAVEVCFQLLDLPTLHTHEQMRAAWRVLEAHYLKDRQIKTDKRTDLDQPTKLVTHQDQDARDFDSGFFTFDEKTKLGADPLSGISDLYYSGLPSDTDVHYKYYDAYADDLQGNDYYYVCLDGKTLGPVKKVYVATDAIRRGAIQKLLKLAQLPGFEPSNYVEWILNSKDSKGKLLAKLDEVSSIIDRVISALGNCDNELHFWPAWQIWDQSVVELTDSQLKILIPFMLESLKQDFTDDNFKARIARKVISHTAATDEQRQQAIEFFITQMNDATKDADQRKCAAREVLQTSAASDAQGQTAKKCLESL